MQRRVLAPFVILAALMPATVSFAAAAEAKTAVPRVNVYQYAMDNPVADTQLKIVPTLGSSVPASVALSPCEGEKTYVYFYYGGQPVIVEQATRSIVRIGQSN